MKEKQATIRAIDSQPPKDWWDKASILSGFFSGVIIAIVGIVISLSIQKAQLRNSESALRMQLDADARRAEDDRRVQQGSLTAQLLQHLTSKDATEREIAIVALSSSVTPAVAERVLAAIARRDVDPAVRTAAIQRLSDSSNPAIARELQSIAAATRRPSGERTLAEASGREAAIRQFLPLTTSGGAFLLASATEGSAYWAGRFNNTVFAHFLTEAVAGGADIDRSGRITCTEIARYMDSQFRSYTAQEMTKGLRQPLAAFIGNRDTVLIGAEAPFSRVVGLFVRISDYDDLPNFDAGNINKVVETLEQKLQMRTLRVEWPWDRAGVLRGLETAESQIGPSDLLIIYYSGYAHVAKDGIARWLLYSPKGNDVLASAELSAFLLRSKAKYKAVFMDVGFGVAPATRLAQ